MTTYATAVITAIRTTAITTKYSVDMLPSDDGALLMSEIEKSGGFCAY
jgi:hypothetical protein